MTRSSRIVDTKYLSFPCKAIPGWSTDSLLIDILEKSNSGEKQFQRHGVCLSKGYVRVTSGDCLFQCHAKWSREMWSRSPWQYCSHDLDCFVSQRSQWHLEAHSLLLLTFLAFFRIYTLFHIKKHLTHVHATVFCNDRASFVCEILNLDHAFVNSRGPSSHVGFLSHVLTHKKHFFHQKFAYYCNASTSFQLMKQ